MTIFRTGTLNKRTVPPRQGRQGFYDKLIAGLVITVFAICVYSSAPDKIRHDNSFFTISLAAVGILGVIAFVVAEGLSRPPHNGPHQCVTKDKMKGKRDEDERVLVCLGDSLTHGACSANWVDSIVTSLTTLQQFNDRAERPPNLLVVNAGQNSICTHTVLHEKVNHVLACKPDYIFIMIGSNDAMAIYRDDWAREKMSLWNLMERPTEDVLIRNLTDTIQVFLDQTTAEIAIATLPPFGEDSESDSNKVIHSINARIRMLEQLFICKLGDDDRLAQRVSIIDVNDALWTEIRRHRRSSETKTIQSIDSFLPYAIVMGLLHCVFGFTWNTLTRLLTGNVVMSEALHLNEDGGNIVKNEVVRWLMNRQTHRHKKGQFCSPTRKQ